MVLVEIGRSTVIQGKPQASPSSLSVIEAAYDLAVDDTAWLSALVRELQPFVDDGLGLYGHFYAFDEENAVLRATLPVFLGCEQFAPALAKAAALMPERNLVAAYGALPCRSLSQVHAEMSVSHSEVESVGFLQRETGIADALMVNAWLRPGSGVCIVAPLRRVSRFPARTASVLGRVARHIAAARRLRQSLRRSPDGVALEAEAVFDPRGAVLHAEGEAEGKPERELLSATARNLASAKERWRESDPEQVASLWNALVDGRWSLVDSFDRDGKRFLLARRNAMELNEPGALSPAERQVAALFARGHSTKLVAYELGLSASNVSGTLKRALRKLRLRSATELISLFSAR